MQKQCEVFCRFQFTQVQFEIMNRCEPFGDSRFESLEVLLVKFFYLGEFVIAIHISRSDWQPGIRHRMNFSLGDKSGTDFFIGKDLNIGRMIYRVKLDQIKIRGFTKLFCDLQSIFAVDGL